MVKNFQDKVAVITGAGSGIGRALAVELAGRGTRLALSGRNLANVAETAALCEKAGAEARAYEVDVADRAGVLEHADAVVAEFGRVNLVVNNAGVSMVASVNEMAWEDLEWIVNINFWGVIHGTKAFLPHLISAGEGHVVNISSMFGLAACPTQSAYNATKFGIRGFTEALRQELRLEGHPVSASGVYPGMVRTDISRKMRVGRTRDRNALASNFERMAARMSPEKAAKKIVRGIQKDKAKILVGVDAYAIDLMTRFLGSGYQTLITAGAKRDPALRPAAS